MNWDAIGAIGEIVGAIAVIATLFYLATQIRQGINSVQGATELDASKQFSEWHARITGSSELRRAWDKAAADEELTEDEHSAYVWLIAELFFLLEGFYRQYQRRLISDSSWDPLKTSLLTVLKNRIVAEWWDNETAPLSGEFRAHINDARGKEVEYTLADTRRLRASK